MVMPNQVTPTSAATGPGTEEGRRPTIVPGPLAASPELSPRPRRRTFTVQDKLRILAETDQAAESRSTALSCAGKGFTHRRLRIGGASALPEPTAH
ncbi:MAG: transposase [Rhodospirillales bacterium]|nr:transposase [Rhodospirillales bacterium]